MEKTNNLILLKNIKQHNIFNSEVLNALFYTLSSKGLDKQTPRYPNPIFLKYNHRNTFSNTNNLLKTTNAILLCYLEWLSKDMF